MARIHTEKALKTKADSTKSVAGKQRAALKERSKDRKGKGKANEVVEVELVTGLQGEDVRFNVSCFATLSRMAHDSMLLACPRERRFFVPFGAQVIPRLCGCRTAGSKKGESQGEEGET